MSNLEASKQDRKKPEPARNKGRPKHDDQRVGPDTIIAATKELLQEQPYTEVNRRGVALKAGVAPGLIRYYFTDLTALLTHVLKDMIYELRSELVRISEGPGTAGEILGLRVRYLVGFFAENPAFRQMFLDLVIQSESEWAQQTSVDLLRVAFGEFKAITENAVSEDSMAESIDPRFLYILVFGGTEFFTTGSPIFKQLFGEQEWRGSLGDEYAEFLSSLILQGIAPR